MELYTTLKEQALRHWNGTPRSIKAQSKNLKPPALATVVHYSEGQYIRVQYRKAHHTIKWSSVSLDPLGMLVRLH